MKGHELMMATPTAGGANLIPPETKQMMFSKQGKCLTEDEVLDILYNNDSDNDLIPELDSNSDSESDNEAYRTDIVVIARRLQINWGKKIDRKVVYLSGSCITPKNLKLPTLNKTHHKVPQHDDYVARQFNPQ
ncbi:hypothetical protein C0J52_20825 [Blattella germanica]|nr:hypothetical protein C0J52_20825 [Blattella germanica]